ncbi:hypothetical protein [Leifsonia xyli]|uniref:hypothetical protein n=1 Tax=Leifsonia xyli TaxID=1575 RepID=UPI003D67C7BB
MVLGLLPATLSAPAAHAGNESIVGDIEEIAYPDAEHVGRVKVVRPGIAVALDEYKNVLGTEWRPRDGQVAQAFVDRIDALLSRLEETEAGKALIDRIGRLDPTGQTPGSVYLRPDGTRSDINVLVVPEPRAHSNTPISATGAGNGDGSVTMLKFEDGARGEVLDHVWTLEGDPVLPESALIFGHELIHAEHSLAGGHYPYRRNAEALYFVPGGEDTLWDAYVGDAGWMSFDEEAFTHGGHTGLAAAHAYQEYGTFETPNGLDEVTALPRNPLMADAVAKALQRVVDLRAAGAPAADIVEATRIAAAREEAASTGATELKLSDQLGTPTHEEYTTTFNSHHRELKWGKFELKPGFTEKDLTVQDRLHPKESSKLRIVSQDELVERNCGAASFLMCSPPDLSELRRLGEAETARLRQVRANGLIEEPVSSSLLRGHEISLEALRELAGVEFERMAREGGRFKGLAELGEADGFAALPGMRDPLNEALQHTHGAGVYGEALDKVGMFLWLTSILQTWGNDLSALDKAAIFGGQVPVLAESLGIASAAVKGDKVNVARNVIGLVATLAGLGAMLAGDPVVGIVIGLMGLLVGEFIAAIKDTSPVQYETMKNLRDEQFREWLPSHIGELAAKVASSVGEMFAVWQRQQVFTLMLTEAAIDREAVATIKRDPASQSEVLQKATETKQKARDLLQTKLRQDREGFVTQGRAAFIDGFSATAGDSGVVRQITDEVFPLGDSSVRSFEYGELIKDGRPGSDSSWPTYVPEPEGAAWPWAGQDGVMGGWDLFAADAKAAAQGRFPGIPKDQPWCRAHNEEAADYAAKSVDWLNQNCYATLARMSERYAGNVTRLRGDGFPAADQAAVGQEFDRKIAEPAVQADLTVMALPAVRDMTAPITPHVSSPGFGVSGVDPLKMSITGLAAVGHLVRVHVENQYTHAPYDTTAIADERGVFTTTTFPAPYTVFPPENSSQILRPENYTVTVVDRDRTGTSVFTSADLRPTITEPRLAATGVRPGQMTVSGTAGPKRQLTLRVLGSGDIDRAIQVTADRAGKWSVPLVVGVEHATGEAVQLDITDDALHLHHESGFTVADWRTRLNDSLTQPPASRQRRRSGARSPCTGPELPGNSSTCMRWTTGTGCPPTHSTRLRLSWRASRMRRRSSPSGTRVDGAPS